MTHSLIRRHTQTHTNTRLSVATSHHTQVCHIYGEGENHNRMRYSRMHTRRNQNKNDFDALFVVSPPKPLLLSLYLSTVLRVVSTWFLCFASWHRVCLLFDQLWMSKSGKLNAVHPFIYAQNWNRLWCRWQREIKKPLHIEQLEWKWNNVLISLAIDIYGNDGKDLFMFMCVRMKYTHLIWKRASGLRYMGPFMRQIVALWMPD